MTLRRVAAFAQTLAIVSIFLAPGLEPGGPARARAAIAPAAPAADVIFDATGNGIGCQAGSRKYKGPREPRDPPWPPGAEPTPTPSAIPSADAALESIIIDPAASPSPSPLAAGPTMLLAGTGNRVALADPQPDPSAAPADPAAEVTTETAAAPTRKIRKSKLIAGIDVSHHNKEIDFGVVHSADKRFVFMKATESNDFIDPRFLINFPAAKAAGLAVAGYHVFDYTLDGKAQADHFVDRLQVADALDDTLPPVVDVECWGYRGTSTHVLAEARLRDFVARLYQRTGRFPILYTSLYMWSQVVGDAEGFEHLPLWAVCWSCDAPKLAAGWDDWVFWQTGVSRIKGLGKKLDGNVFRGSQAELQAMQLRPLAIEDGAAVTGSQLVELDLGGRDATQLRTSLDGETWSAWGPVRARARAELAATEGEQTLSVQLRAGKGMRSPTFTDSITLDQTGPQVEALTVSLREGDISAGSDRVPVKVTWSARDELAGLSDAVVAVACADERSQRTEAPGSADPGMTVAWEAVATLAPDTTCDVTAISRDGVGNVTRETIADVPTVRVPHGNGSATVQGQQVGVIARRGPDAGRAAITLDGEVVALVDLYASASTDPAIIQVLDLQPGVRHRIEVSATGTRDPAAVDGSVPLEGFVTLG